MAMERPVVATRVGGIPEIVEEGKTGYLVRPEDAAEISEKVISLLKNRELRREMGIRGRLFVKAHHDNRLMVKRLEQLYKKLMGERKS